MSALPGAVQTWRAELRGRGVLVVGPFSMVRTATLARRELKAFELGRRLTALAEESGSRPALYLAPGPGGHR